MTSEVADLQLAMKQATKEQELLQSQVDTDSKAEEVQTQLQELHKKLVTVSINVMFLFCVTLFIGCEIHSEVITIETMHQKYQLTTLYCVVVLYHKGLDFVALK